jgi:hypothetical protein
LNATLYPPENRRIKKLLDSCTNKDNLFIRWFAVFAIEVEMENERVYLLYWKLVDSPEEVKTQLQKQMRSRIGYNYAIVYNNVVYNFENRVNIALRNAILQKIKPDLAALLAVEEEPKCRKTVRT